MFCEEPTVDSKGKLHGNSFCVNGGQCRDEAHKGCDCPDGYTGFKCEFYIGTSSSSSWDDDDDYEDDDEFDDDDDDVEPEPLLCGDMYCFNGGTCVISQDSIAGLPEVRYSCDCSNAIHNNNMYAGNSCQYRATEYCDDPNDADDLDEIFFCVNGGHCNDETVQDGCDCPDGGCQTIRQWP